jgi:hypothetical protein
MVFVLSKKNPLSAFRADSGFFFFLIGEFMPLSTLCLAEDNYTLDEYDKEANKVSDGGYVTHNLYMGLNFLKN